VNSNGYAHSAGPISSSKQEVRIAGTSGSLNLVSALLTDCKVYGSITTAVYAGLETSIVDLSSGAATISQCFGVKIGANTAANLGSSITCGLRIYNQSGGTNNYAIYTEAGQNRFGDVVLLSDGTVSLPGGAWISDPNTGLYRIGNDNPGMACDGALIQSWSTDGSAFNGNVSATGRYHSTLVPNNLYAYSFQAANEVSWTGTADTGIFGSFTSYFKVTSSHTATNLAHQMFRLVYAKQAGAANPAVADHTHGVHVEYDFNESESAAVDGCNVAIDVDTGKTVTTFAAYRAGAKTGSGTITNQYSFIGESGAGIANVADGISTSGQLIANGAVDHRIGAMLIPSAGTGIEINYYGSGDRNTYIDLHAQDSVDFSARIIRE
jgi:hypothetical protein